MACYRTRVLALGLLCAALAPPAWAGGPPPRNADDDARKVAAQIDSLIDTGLARAPVKPAPLADDGVFLRRLSLDVVGKTPPVADVRRFLADKSPDKREAAVKRLLDTLTRLYLGVRLECAQCHDHPFGRWTREQFWGQAAFFAGSRKPRSQNYFVDPLDDFSDDNPPSHPELLDLLAREFVAHKFDLKFLIRVITSSRAYQRSSAGRSSPGELRLFGRMPVKGLSPEQLFDSLCEATGHRDTMTRQQRLFSFGTPRQELMDRSRPRRGGGQHGAGDGPPG